MSAGVLIGQSAINGRGVFANRDFARGETVIAWHPKLLTHAQLSTVPVADQVYMIKLSNRWYLMQSPERYVNHSCDANTKTVGRKDVARRNIKSGEEITSDYAAIISLDSFRCHCGSAQCRGAIGRATRNTDE